MTSTGRKKERDAKIFARNFMRTIYYEVLHSAYSHEIEECQGEKAFPDVGPLGGKAGKSLIMTRKSHDEP